MPNKIAKGFNWKYALGEICLIFIGITSAIWFNNWNGDRQSQQIEVKSIKEIRSAVNQDLIDIENNIAGFGTRVNLYKQLIQHMEEEKPLGDSLKAMLPYILGITAFISNIGPYETLKAKGLDIITNDSIRLQIAVFYDFEYELIQLNEKQHFEHYLNNLKPLVLEHLDFSKGMLPFNEQAWLKDQSAKQTIHWALMVNQNMLSRYQQLLVNGERLIRHLDREIKRLE